MLQLVLLCGGRSAEHEISLLSTASVLKHLDRSRYGVRVLGIRKDGGSYTPERLGELLRIEEGAGLGLPRISDWIAELSTMRPRPDVVFPLLHGPQGEDGTVQGLLELLDVAFVGADTWGSAVGMNKVQCKRLLRGEGLPVLAYVAFSASEWRESPEACFNRVQGILKYPLFVKPSKMGSSIGVNKSRNRHELQRYVDAALKYDDRVLVEQGIDAREIEVSVIGNEEPRASLAGEIIPSREFYSYEAKYLDDSSRLLIPAPLDETKMEEARDLALRAYRLLDLEGMARMDFLLDKSTGKLWINEPNTIPGFTRISMYPKLWEASGLSYPALLDELIELALKRHTGRRSLAVEWK